MDDDINDTVTSDTVLEGEYFFNKTSSVEDEDNVERSNDDNNDNSDASSQGFKNVAKK